MKRICAKILSGFVFGVVAVMISLLAMPAGTGAKTKVVTTKNGTKLYCSGSKDDYTIYKIENEKKDLIIPETVDGKHRITSFYFDIQYFWEGKYKKVEHIHFPSGMDDLSEDMSDSEDYRYNTFNAFPNLKKISFDKRNKYYSVKDGAVYNRKKKLVAIAPGVSKVKLSSRMTDILPNAYADLTKLEHISVEKGNKKYKSIKGALYTKDGKKLIYYPIARKDKIFRIPAGVKEIGKAACYEQKYIKEVVMSHSVHEIGELAFGLCDRLKKVTLNEELKILGYAAFCNNNENWLDLSLPEGIEEVEIGSLPVRELEIPAGVKKVKLDVDLHGDQSEIRAETLIVRSRSLDLIKMDKDYSFEMRNGNTPEKNAYSGKTICAYEDSKAYKQLKPVAEIYGITLKLLEG